MARMVTRYRQDMYTQNPALHSGACVFKVSVFVLMSVAVIRWERYSKKFSLHIKKSKAKDVVSGNTLHTLPAGSPNQTLVTRNLEKTQHRYPSQQPSDSVQGIKSIAWSRVHGNLQESSSRCGAEL